MPRKINLTPCRCAAFSVLVNLRETESGDLVWDERLTTGCPGTLTGRDFAPGHDAKLKGFLIRWGVEGHEVTYNDGGSALVGGAIGMADRFGFAQQVRSGIAKGLIKAEIKKLKRGERSESCEVATEKLAEIVDRDEQLLAERNQPAEVDLLEDATDDVEPVKAKVGRWIYEGVVDGDEFVYTGKSGDEKRTTKFTRI